MPAPQFPHDAAHDSHNKSELASLHERQTKLETNVSNLTDNVTALTGKIDRLADLGTNNAANIKLLIESMHGQTDTANQQWQKLDKLTSLAQGTANRAGRFTTSQLVSILLPVVVVIGGLAALYVAPLTQRVDMLQQTLTNHVSGPGHMDDLVFRADIAAKLATNTQQLAELRSNADRHNDAAQAMAIDSAISRTKLEALEKTVERLQYPRK